MYMLLFFMPCTTAWEKTHAVYVEWSGVEMALTGVEEADDDIPAGFVEGRQPLAAVGPLLEPFLESQKLPRPRGVRRPPPLAPERRHHLAPLCSRRNTGPDARLQIKNCELEKNMLYEKKSIVMHIIAATLSCSTC